MTDGLHAAGPKAGLREWIGLAVLTLPTLLVSIDVSVVILALPHISESLGADSAQQLWIMDIYGFMLAGFMITMGTLGDRIGRRKLLMFGGTAFGIASVLAAFSSTASMLILSRALLGVAGATLAPSALALITNMFRDTGQRAFAISIWMVGFMSGMVVGPLVGGFMLEHFWWGSVFLLGVPAMVLLLATAPALLPEYRDPHAGRLDFASVGLSLCAILPVIFGLKEIAKNGPAAAPIAAILGGICFGIAFVIRQRRLDDPLLDLGLFANRAFATAVGSMFAITLTGALMLFISQYLQLVMGLSPLRAGLWLLPGVAASVVGFLLAPLIAQRMRPAPLIAAGLLVSAAGLLLIMQVRADTGLAALVVGFALMNIGGTPLVTLSSGIVVGSAPPEKAGSAAAMSETSAELGFALGIATLGSLATTVYRHQIGDQLPLALPPEAIAAARDTLAGAIVAASQLEATVAGPLLAAAREAFLSAMHMVALFSAVLVVGLAAFNLVLLRHVRPIGQGGAPEPEAGLAIVGNRTEKPPLTSQMQPEGD
ncbi:MFS transporter [Kaistia granuli]|uniref:MFS transporter n=1 Tax=Kaistia granuli TaxID=363259 RepID=UPI000372C6D2|nr:MFS transporter [Kaistia granuli]